MSNIIKTIKSAQKDFKKYIDIMEDFTETEEEFQENHQENYKDKVYKIDELYQKKVDTAYKRGFQEGLKKNLDKLRIENQQRIDSMLNGFSKHLDVVKTSFANLTKRYHIESINLALVIAEKIIGEIGQNDKNAIIFNIKKALEKVNRDVKITLKLHSKDIKYFSENSQILDSTIEESGVQPSNLELCADDTIQQGGCLLETNISSVDARLSEQFEELKKGLNENYLTIIDDAGGE